MQDSKHSETWTDGNGTLWRYVEYENRGIQIERCITQTDYLEMPSEIDDRPVLALAVESCAYLQTVKEIWCPDSILSIGLSVFRGNEILTRIRFPQNLKNFDSGWLRNCPRVNHVTLPGSVAILESNIFDIPQLETLVIGRNTRGIKEGMFAKSKLKFLEVDAKNPYLITDGKALYLHDQSELLALAVPLTEYSLIKGCRKIAGKGFSNFSSLEKVELNEELEILDDFAFSRTSITEITTPPALKRIEKKVFYNCKKLKEVTLNEGLASIAEHAFSGTAISELTIPASIKNLEYPLAADTKLTYTGEEASFRIAEGSSNLILDEEGALYRANEEDRQLVRLMNPKATSYEVRKGTIGIDDSAFASLVYLKKVKIPEGVKTLGQGAFKGCINLEELILPLDVEHIGDEACLDTALRSIHIPAALNHLGKMALVTKGAHQGFVEPSLKNIWVAKENKHFYTSSGLLLERKENGKSRVIICTGSVDVVRIPYEVDEISEYAFNNVRGIRELHISDRILYVGVRGLTLDGHLSRIRIDITEPIDGRYSFDISFPPTDRGELQKMHALGAQGRIDARVFHEHYDSAIVNASSFDAATGRSLNLYEQVKLIAARMLDPVFMTTANRSMFDHVLQSNLIDMCIEIARRDDRRTMDILLDLGYIHEDNICEVIDAVSVLQDAVITSHLLEAKRTRFRQISVNFDI